MRPAARALWARPGRSAPRRGRGTGAAGRAPAPGRRSRPPRPPLPLLDGFEVLRAIAADRALSDVPVLASAGSAIRAPSNSGPRTSCARRSIPSSSGPGSAPRWNAAAAFGGRRRPTRHGAAGPPARGREAPTRRAPPGMRPLVVRAAARGPRPVLARMLATSALAAPAIAGGSRWPPPGRLVALAIHAAVSLGGRDR